MPNQFLSPEGDIENYFVSEYWLIDQYIGDTLWTWGLGTSGQLGNFAITAISTPVTTFAGGTNWKQVSSGDAHTAAIKTDGTLWTWGRGSEGQLGNFAATSRSTPVTTFAGGTNWKQVSSGYRHTAAIKIDGTLWTWGQGTYGRLGTNDLTDRNTPVTTFAGGTNWKQVSSGYKQAAAIKTDGTLWVWGLGTSGQLGNGDFTDRSTPVTTSSGGTNWKQVSSGGDYTAAIKTDGTLWTWGSGFSGRLGNNPPESVSTPVTTFAGGTNWDDVEKDLYTLSSGREHTAAIKTDGTLWTWGSGADGRLGNFATTSRSTPVTTFAGGTDWKQVSAGGSHTAAIKTDGTLWTWGAGTFVQLGTNDVTTRSTPVTTFAGGTDWKQVSSGYAHTAAIKTDGTLWTWGRGDSGRLGNFGTTNRSTPVTTFAGGTDWKQVSAGGGHTAAIKTDGTLWTWGAGTNGQLGNFAATNRSTPVTTFAGGADWKQVGSGTGHTVAIKTDGTLWTWGAGTNGRLGNNDTINKNTPVTTFAGGTDWKQVSAGGGHIAAIKTDGTLWTWGRGVYGELGNFDTTDRSTPVTTFAGGTNWKQVSSGYRHTAALKDDGINKELYLFGEGTSGQLGNSDITNRSTPVTTFAGGTNWDDVEKELYTLSAGDSHTAAIKTDGTLWTWGRGTLGRLGNFASTDRFTPVTTFAGGTNWKQVSSGGYHTAAIKTDGTLWTWGFGGSGRLGTNDSTNRSTPVTTFAGGTDWKQVSSGDDYTAAIKTDGTLWTWGQGASGRLGNFDIFIRNTPVTTFAGGTNWKQVSCGDDHTAAIKTDGTLWTWGYALNGKLGTFDLTTRSTPVTTFAGGTDWKQVSSGRLHTAAIKTDGTLWTWGTGGSGQLGTNATTQRNTPVTTFAGGTDWKQVSSGRLHTAAIKTDGTLWTWGNGFFGELGTFAATNRSTPVTTFAGGTDWKQVSSGGYHTVALRDDGLNKELYLFGLGSSGQLGIDNLFHRSTPVTTFAGGTNWKQVSSGGYHTAAIKTDGTLWTWGEGSSGRLGNFATADRSTPVTTFAGGTDWKQVSSGDSHTAAVTTGISAEYPLS